MKNEINLTCPLFRYATCDYATPLHLSEDPDWLPKLMRFVSVKERMRRTPRQRWVFVEYWYRGWVFAVKRRKAACMPSEEKMKRLLFCVKACTNKRSRTTIICDKWVLYWNLGKIQECNYIHKTESHWKFCWSRPATLNT